MASYEYEVVSKEVVFTEGQPTSPYKLFTVTGDVTARILPVITDSLNTEDAILTIGEQGINHIFYMDSGYEDSGKRIDYPVSSDLYLTINWSIETPGTLTGTVIFYCIFAKLSADGEVQ